MGQPSKEVQMQQLIMFWVVWFSILSGLFIMMAVGGDRTLAGGTGIPPKPEAWSMMSILGLVLAGMGVFCRILVVPRVAAMQAKLTVMIIGLALCEACGVIGIFVVDSQLPRERIFLFWVAVMTVMISAPIYTLMKPKTSPFRQS